jgi:hydroxycarboxylate dehydrogenase B
MAEGKSSVGEVRVKPDRLHAFTMAICRADGSSDQEARLVADHLVLANLFGHDSHGVGMIPHYIQNTGVGACVRNNHAKIIRDNGAVIVIDGGAGYGQVVAKEAMDIGIERAKKHGVCVVGLTNAHHIGRIGHWGEQCARAGMVSTHWVNVHGHKSLVAPFGGAEPRFTTNPYCTAVPRKGKEPIVLDFATSQVAAGKVRVANNKKVQMDEGLLIDAAGHPTTDPGVLYNAPYGAILPFGLHKGGGLAVICDLLAGALTGGRTHSPRTIKKDSTDIINNMLSIIIDPASMGGTEMFEDEVETFITWVKSAKPQPGVPEVLAPGEPERARKVDREKNGVPIDGTTWQQLLDVARKVRLNDTEIPQMAAA